MSDNYNKQDTKINEIDDPAKLKIIKKAIANPLNLAIQGKQLHEITAREMAAPIFELNVDCQQQQQSPYTITTVISSRDLQTQEVITMTTLGIALSKADCDKLYIVLNQVYQAGLAIGVMRIFELNKQIITAEEELTCELSTNKQQLDS